ncbi:MAG: hypothetical protein KAV82_08960 [Phycisphaerae bacterium]|nr:hypothetical protein [Phycisphaerae bacterium]
MSALTKIFIVLLAVFSIAFAMSTVSFVSQTSNWRKLAEDYQSANQILETKMMNQSAAHAAEKANWLDARREHLRQTAELEGEFLDLQTDQSQLNADMAQLKSEKMSAEALARNLAGQLELASTARDNEQGQREKLQVRNIELEKRNLDLNERVNELTTRTVVLIEQQRQFEQQINILRAENEKLTTLTRRAASGEHHADSSEMVSPVEPVAGTPIRGRIIEVDGKLATISVGSADGVQENMMFVIYRGMEYIGDIKVTDVAPHTSAGTITRARGTPQLNDLVADETRFGMAG